MANVVFVDSIVHRWLKVPYRLNVRYFNSPKKPREIVVLIHGLGNSMLSWEQIAKVLPGDTMVIGVDMLGFGKSPRPEWAKYSVKTQARSIARTLLKLGLKRRPIIIGHSMGSLVAIEIARRYPLVVKRLILCSPPLYKKSEKQTIKDRDTLLIELYRVIAKHPDHLVRTVPLAVKLGFVSKALNIEGEKSKTYMAALESSIINQTSFKDIQKLNLPIKIIYGTLDPVVIGANIKQLGNEKPNITIKKFVAGHEIIGRFQKLLGKELSQLLRNDKLDS